MELDVVVVGNGWEPAGLPDGVRAVALPEDRGIPGGPQRRRRRGRAASCCSSSTTTRAWPTPDALARVAARFAADPDLGLLQLRVDASDGGPAAARLGAAPARRRPRALERRDGGLGGRGGDAARAVFEQVGGWPEEFRRAHEGVDLAWRVMDAGYRVAYAGDIAVLHPPQAPPRRTSTRPTTAPATASGSPAATCRCRSACSTSLAFALRTLPRAALARARPRGAARLPRRAARAVRPAAAALRAKTLWRMTAPAGPPII